MPTQTTDLFLLEGLEDVGRTSELAESALAWVAVVSGFLYMRSPSTATAPERAAVPAP